MHDDPQGRDAQAHSSATPNQESLQADLSCLVDGELHEVEAARVLARLEVDADARHFFDALRDQVQLHRELSDPSALRADFEALTGGVLGGSFEERQLVHQLASIFYQVGKAYALAGLDAGWRQRVFEQAVVVDDARAQGRGFIDGVASKQRGSADGLGGMDWRGKRHLLNGALEHIEAPLDKARRLLGECLEVESDYDPAHLYLAVIDRHEGKVLKAAKRLERVFEEAVDETCRGHAAGQLAKLHVAEEEYREALKYLRWGLQSGLVDQDARFFFFRFNAALCYAHLRQPERSIGALRDALDHHPERAPELARALAGSPVLRACIDSQAGFPEALLQRCPELFAAAPTGEGPSQ